MATGSGPGVTDADREAAAARLREHYAQGRLTLEEFRRRLDAVFDATTQSQLTAIFHAPSPRYRCRPPAPVADVSEPGNSAGQVPGRGWV